MNPDQTVVVSTFFLDKSWLNRRLNLLDFLNFIELF
jgi:hypothetical protein